MERSKNREKLVEEYADKLYRLVMANRELYLEIHREPGNSIKKLVDFARSIVPSLLDDLEMRMDVIDTTLFRIHLGEFGVRYTSTLNRPVAIDLNNKSFVIASIEDGRSLVHKINLFPESQIMSERTRREVKTLRDLDGIPGILKLDSVIYNGDIDEIVGYVMEYFNGKELGVLRNLDLWDKIVAIGQVLTTLSYVHERGLIHRDIKPGNVLCRKEGALIETCLIDFGLVHIPDADPKITQPRELIGTPYYISPEIIEGGNVDNRTDIYSTACTLYVLLANKYPFDGDNALEVLRAIMTNPLPHLPPQFDRELDEILRKGMARNPDDRYQSVEEFRTALYDYLMMKESEFRDRDDFCYKIISSFGDSARELLRDPRGAYPEKVSENSKTVESKQKGATADEYFSDKKKEYGDGRNFFYSVMGVAAIVLKIVEKCHKKGEIIGSINASRVSLLQNPRRVHIDEEGMQKYRLSEKEEFLTLAKFNVADVVSFIFELLINVDSESAGSYKEMKRYLKKLKMDFFERTRLLYVFKKGMDTRPGKGYKSVSEFMRDFEKFLPEEVLEKFNFS